jgi:hypothetical protein
MDEAIPFVSREYFIFLALLTVARGMDILSTRIATPRLVLEGNPIAKWLGWKWGLVLNIALVVALGQWPLSAVIVSTASLLVAARNFQSAWVMRTMGEFAYRDWYLQRLNETGLPLYLLCLAGNALLPAAIGVALILYSQTPDFVLLVPLGVGIGMLAYAFAVLVFTLLGLWRGRRRRAAPAELNLEQS